MHIKYGYGNIPVNIIAGIPQCPTCHIDMIEIEKDQWQCPIAKQSLDLVAADLLKMFPNDIT